MKQYFTFQHVNQAFSNQQILNNALNNFIVPMGSGKSTVIKHILTNTPNTLVLYPYKTSKADFTEGFDVKPNQSYFTDFVNQMFKLTTTNSTYKDTNVFLKMYAKTVFEHIKSMNYTLVLLDESDFFMIQAQATQYSGTITGLKEGESFNIFSDMLTYVTLRSIAQATILLGFSASVFNLPSRVVGMSMYVQGFINNIIINIKPNIEVTEIVLINPEEHDISNLKSALKEVCKGKSLVYQSKWTKPNVDSFLDSKIQWLIRQENFPVVSYNDSGLTTSYGNILNQTKPNTVIDMSHQDSQLHDDKFINYDFIGIGVSSSRAVSLVNNYTDATIIVIDETITANALQILGRFRNSPVKVYWITTKTAAEFTAIAKATDMFFDQYVNTVTCTVNQSIKQILGVSGVASKKGLLIGKSISQTTITKRNTFDTYMATATTPNWKDYSTTYPNGLSRASFFNKLKECTITTI